MFSYIMKTFCKNSYIGTLLPNFRCVKLSFHQSGFCSKPAHIFSPPLFRSVPTPFPRHRPTITWKQRHYNNNNRVWISGDTMLVMNTKVNHNLPWTNTFFLKWKTVLFHFTWHGIPIWRDFFTIQIPITKLVFCNSLGT